MKQLNRTDLRKDWEQLPTPELEAMLQSELERKPPDDDTVLLLLHILEDREAELPLQLSDREKKAWEQYRQKAGNKGRKSRVTFRWLSIAASFVLITAIFFSVIPQQAEAETFWEMLQRMTNTIIEYLSPREKLAEVESVYIFEPNNPGLQQVYDAVVELGVTEPVVPMWLPDGFLLTELKPKNTPMTKGLLAIFADGNSEIVLQFDIYAGEPAHQYYKDDTYYKSYEWDGVTYNITQNNNRWLVVWGKDNIECFLTADCQEDTLRRILKSIYVTEDE